MYPYGQWYLLIKQKYILFENPHFDIFKLILIIICWYTFDIYIRIHVYKNNMKYEIQDILKLILNYLT